MALPAGRVGVNPADVDPITGHVKGDSKHGWGTIVDIKSYVGDNRFTVPSDGYIRFAKSGSTRCNLLFFENSAMASSINDLFFAIPVYAGMTLHFDNAPDYATYYSLV